MTKQKSLKPTAIAGEELELSIVIPAYNEEQVIGEVLTRVKEELSVIGQRGEVILVDDGSGDKTAEIAAAMGARVIRHPYNIGNGAAVKTGIRNACGKTIILMDADGQHSPADIKELLQFIPEYDMVVGARSKESATSLHRSFGNRVYNLFASYLTNRKIADLTSGFRVIRRDVAKKFVYLLPNTFSYPTTITLSLLRAGYSVRYVPITTFKRVGKSKINIVRDGIGFFIIMLKIATLFSPFKIFIPVSLASFVVGVVYGAYMIITHHHFSNMILFLLITALLVFLLGLIAEQLAVLRLERSEK